jgi:uncharacterized FlaG/YvyC family protein
MDFSIAPVGAPSATVAAQPVSQAANDAVATELPPSQSVTAAGAGAAASNNPQAASEDLSDQVVIDQAAASIVYQVVDSLTNTVVQQFPSESVLRRRAYFHALDLAKSTPARPLVTDRTA